MKLTEKQKQEVTVMTSGHYLCECLPSDFVDMSSEDFDEFLVNNAWEPFEYWAAKDIYDCISAAAYSTVRYIEGLNDD